MKKMTLFLLFLIMSNNIFSQNLKDITAAGLNFFLKSDKARNLSQDQKTGLSLLENLLVQQSEREHEINVARAQSSQINIKGTNQEVKILPGDDGGIYLVTGEKVYPLNVNLINEIRQLSSSTDARNKYHNNRSDEPYNDSIYEGEYKFRTKLNDKHDKVDLWNMPDNDNRSSIYDVPKDATIYVIGTANRYYYDVYVNGYRGYIFSLYLKRKE